MTVTGSYFCAWVMMKFSRNDLPLPRRTEHERVTDIVDSAGSRSTGV